MKIHVLQLPGIDTPGYISYWANNRGHELTCTKLYADRFILPEKSDIDVLIILGGPTQDHEDQIRERIYGEKKFIQEFIMMGKMVLMICQDRPFKILSVSKDSYTGGAIAEHISIPVVQSQDQLEAEYWLQIIFDESLQQFYWDRDNSISADQNEDKYESINNSRPFVEYDQRVSGMEFHAFYESKGIIGQGNLNPFHLLKGQYLKATASSENGLLNIFVENEMIREIFDYFINSQNVAA